MNVGQSLICFFFLTMQNGHIGLTNAQIPTYVYKGTKGGDITVRCAFNFPGYRKIFCKDDCKEEDILIETQAITAQRGRYSIRYEEGDLGYPQYQTVLNVSIRNLTQSDSGRYRCGLDRSFLPSSYHEIDLRVTDAPTSPPRPSPPSVPSAPTLMTSQTTSSPVRRIKFILNVPLVLGVCVPVVVVVVVLSAVLLLFYKKRTEHSDGSNKRGNTDITRTEIDLYENCPPPSTRADSTYQSLDPASRDPDHIYSTLS